MEIQDIEQKVYECLFTIDTLLQILIFILCKAVKKM